MYVCIHIHAITATRNAGRADHGLLSEPRGILRIQHLAGVNPKPQALNPKPETRNPKP